MESSFEKNMLVLPSICDASGKMGLADTFAVFMDIASEHAQTLGVGGTDMAKKSAFWLTVRTKVRFMARPYMLQNVSAKTWPTAPGKLRGDRLYKLSCDGKTLAEGKTEWAVLDTSTGKVRTLESIGFPELEFDAENVCDAPFTRFRDDFVPSELIESFTVKPGDTDYGNHMNNVAYVRRIVDTIPTAEITKLNVTEIEINFCKSCFEGEKVDIYRRRDGDRFLFSMRRGETTLALAGITAEDK